MKTGLSQADNVQPSAAGRPSPSACVCRFLGLMVVFVCGALLCFLLTVQVLRRSARRQESRPETKGEYRLVDGQKTPEDASSEEKETMATKT